MKEGAPNYLVKLIPKSKQTIRARNNHIPSYNCRTDCFKYSFFPSTPLNDWFNLDNNIRKTESISIFICKLSSFICSVQSNIYNIFNPKWLKFLICLGLGLSHLNEHRFRHEFYDFMNPLCSCSLEIEDTSHYLLHSYDFKHQPIDFMISVKHVCYV